MILALAQRKTKSTDVSTPDWEPPSAEQARGKSPRLRVRLVLALLCFVFGLILRIESIRTTEANPDEHHWTTRSALVLAHLRAGSYSNMTSHLPHPGIPSSFSMAFGQFAAEKWNARNAAMPYSPRYIDTLAASRIVSATASALILPLLILSSFSLIGFLPVLLAAALLTFDCQHLALSRIAHIDGMLTLLSTACLLLAFWAERNSSAAARIGAGVLWGLSISTKPTAAALIGVIFAYKALRRYFTADFVEQRPQLLHWSDIWAVVVGHAVLGSLYTKLWDPSNTYLSKHFIHPPLSFFLGDLSAHLRSQPVLFAAIAVATALAGAWLFTVRNNAPRRSYHLGMLFLLCGTLFILTHQFPHPMENLVRFWYWVGGLSRRTHQAYGMVWEPAGAGYIEMWARRLPTVILAGILSGIVFFIGDWRRMRVLADGERLAFLAALLLAPVIWTIPLSVSSKQTVRYVVPMYPALFLFASWGLFRLVSFLVHMVRFNYSVPLTHATRRTCAILCCLIIFQALVAAAWGPNYSLYFNRVTGGVPAALERGFVLSPVGYNEALRYLHDIGERSQDKIRVEVLGDIDLMKYQYARLYPPEGRKKVELLAFDEGIGADYVLEFENFSRRYDTSVLGDTYRFEPVITFVEDGGVVYRLLRAEIPPFDLPEVLPIRHGARNSGAVVDFGEDGKNVKVAPSFAKPGYAHFDQYVRIRPGRYRITFQIALFDDVDDKKKGDRPIPGPETPAIRIEASRRCTRSVSMKEIPSYNLTPVVLECTFAETARVQLSAYWFGQVPVRLGDISVQSIH